MRKLTPAEITCIASSRKEPSKGCEKVTFQSGTLIFLNGQAFDNRELEPSFWASNGQGVGARIRANFARPVKIVKLKVGFSSEVKSKNMNSAQILQRRSHKENNKEISLDTSSGWSQTAMLPVKVKLLSHY